ncbi:MAG: hypothetical protein K8W52_03705, partial [Deltaproteobacteria bacterium]|nr:hypothetical protein [Deltaproteobacteria bacterium]
DAVRRSLLGQGRCLVRLDRAADAIAPLERAVGLIPTSGALTLHDHLARAWLGRALVGAGRERGRGLALARTARAPIAAEVAKDHDYDRELRDLDAWLAKHR